jgi:nicotinamidase-related amidase
MMETQVGRHETILDRNTTALLVVDVQERLWTVMRQRQRVAERIDLLIRGCQLLRVPIYHTEQYPQGLGPTIASVQELFSDTKPLVKMTFSCCGLTQLPRTMKEKGIVQLLLVGIEAHVCVLQTALDFLSQGFQVHLVTDAISSRNQADQEIALRRLSREGVILSTVETALFELLTTAEAPEFKSLSELIKSKPVSKKEEKK